MLLLLLGLRAARTEGRLLQEIQGTAPGGGERGRAGGLPERHARSVPEGHADRHFQGDERLKRVWGSGASDLF